MRIDPCTPINGGKGSEKKCGLKYIYLPVLLITMANSIAKIAAALMKKTILRSVVMS